MACRNMKKAIKAKEDIIKLYPKHSKQIIIMYLDLNDLKSVVEFSKQIIDKKYPISVLINNAGLFVLFFSQK